MKPKFMKRILIPLLTTLLVLSASVAVLTLIPVAQGNILSDEPVDISAYGSGDMSPRQITADYCIHLNLGAPFNQLAPVMVAWGDTNAQATLALYKWTDNYFTTLSSEPVAYTQLTPVADCAANVLSFEEMPAGEYLFRISDIKGTVGVMQCEQTVSKSYCYDSGKESRADWWLTVSFTKTPAEPFLDTYSMLDAIDGSHTPPAEWQPAQDHLLNTHKVMPDTWVFTDGLGRESLTYEDVGGPKDKTVAMFYWTWHGDLGGNNPLNLTEFMEKYPEAKNDYDHPAWPTDGVAYFWNEPIYGYYKTTDEWVLRRQAELLANAGVDTIFTDNTNGGFTWKTGYDVLYPTWEKAQSEGAVDTPKVSFTLPFYPFNESYDQIVSLYLDIYRSGKYHSLWFYWEDQPLLMGCNDHFAARTDNIRKEIYKFFTWRSTLIGGTENSSEYKLVGQWGWLSTYPQVTFPGTRQHAKDKTIEQTTVGVSQNYNYMTQSGTAMNGEFVTGRSYTSTFQDRYEKEGAEATKWGYFFSEQFDYALEKDPEVIFITGWNEWTAGRHQEWSGIENAFPDQFTDEYSRDIEPTKGDLKDHYYYQMVNYVRKFKGVNPIPTPSIAATVDISKDNTQWNTIEPYYAAYIGNTGNRDAGGYGDLYYSEYSGRNDIIGARVARDEENVYFYVECNEDITPYTDPLWMVLYIDSDQQNQGWETFDYVLNKTSPSAAKATLEKFTGNGYETEVVGEVDYTVNGKYMQVKVPKALLNLSGYDFTVNFAWTDNVHDEADKGENGDKDYVYTTFSGDIMDFYISGDVAPSGRFKYSFISTAANAGVVVEEPDTTPETKPVTEPVTEPATEPTTDAVTDEPTTNATTDSTDTTAPETDAPEDEGCGSSLGLGVAGITVAVAAAVALRKKDD